MNIPTKAFCPPICILFICSESCFYVFGWMDSTWRRRVGLAYKNATGDPPFFEQSEYFAIRLPVDFNDHLLRKATQMSEIMNLSD